MFGDFSHPGLQGLGWVMAVVPPSDWIWPDDSNRQTLINLSAGCYCSIRILHVWLFRRESLVQIQEPISELHPSIYTSLLLSLHPPNFAYKTFIYVYVHTNPCMFIDSHQPLCLESLAPAEPLIPFFSPTSVLMRIHPVFSQGMFYFKVCVQHQKQQDDLESPSPPRDTGDIPPLAETMLLLLFWHVSSPNAKNIPFTKTQRKHSRLLLLNMQRVYLSVWWSFCLVKDKSKEWTGRQDGQKVATQNHKESK